MRRTAEAALDRTDAIMLNEYDQVGESQRCVLVESFSLLKLHTMSAAIEMAARRA